jgi:hypothetical protein
MIPRSVRISPVAQRWPVAQVPAYGSQPAQLFSLEAMRKNTSSNVLLRKAFKRSRKELRDTLRALYKKNNPGAVQGCCRMPRIAHDPTRLNG